MHIQCYTYSVTHTVLHIRTYAGKFDHCRMILHTGSMYVPHPTPTAHSSPHPHSSFLTLSPQLTPHHMNMCIYKHSRYMLHKSVIQGVRMVVRLQGVRMVVRLQGVRMVVRLQGVRMVVRLQGVRMVVRLQYQTLQYQ